MVEAEVQARAEQQILGYLEGQQQYRASINRWSYGRLTEKIQSQSAPVGIVIERANSHYRERRKKRQRV